MECPDAAKGFLRFLQYCGDIKRVRRTGWVRKGIRDVESVSDHMYRMAVMAMLFTSDLQSEQERQVDRERCIKLALVHDLAECIVGDITPHDGISKEEKNKRETQAIQQITSSIPKSIADEFRALWEEYEAGLTPEAMLVKDLDKFEMILQAYEYEKIEKRPGECQEFFDSATGQIVDAFNLTM
jgi:putative hydrolase of HD superfamily